MPELLTKHPDVVIEVLSESGAKCATGAPQKILKECPRDRFCALPTGELCVFGLEDKGQMTQISARDLCPAVAGCSGAWGVEGGAAGLLAVLLVAVLRLHGTRRRRRRLEQDHPAQAPKGRPRRTHA
ncbi:MAG: hypothetical protein AB2A00_07365 [Myxococcota bacterium]